MLNVIPLFSKMEANHLASISAHAALFVVNKGDIIVKQGGKADSLFVIAAGRVKVYMTDDQGREVTLKTLGAGEFFGEIPLFDQETRSATVVALEMCHLQVLSYSAFQRCLDRSPDIARRVMATLAQRLRDADRKISTLALMDISARVSRVLMELAIVSNGRKIVGEQLTQKDLGSMIGASREMVNRTLKDLTEQGFIEVQRRSITILDDNLASLYQTRSI